MKLLFENWRSYLNEFTTDTGEGPPAEKRKKSRTYVHAPVRDPDSDMKSMYEKDREIYKIKVEREIHRAKKKYLHSLSAGRSYKKIIDFLVRTTKLNKQEAEFHYLVSILPVLLSEIRNVKYDFEELPGKTTYGAFTVEGGARIVIDARFADPWHEDWKRSRRRRREPRTERPTLKNTVVDSDVPWQMGIPNPPDSGFGGGKLVLTTFIHELGHFVDYLWTTEKIKYPGKACDALPFFDMHSKDKEWKMKHCTPAELQRKDLGRLYEVFLELTYGERKTGKLTRTKAEYESDLHEAAAHVREIFITLDRDVALGELKDVCEFKEWIKTIQSGTHLENLSQLWSRNAKWARKKYRTWEKAREALGDPSIRSPVRRGFPKIYFLGWNYSLLFKNRFIQQLNCKRLTKERVDALNRVTKVDPSQLPVRKPVKAHA